ncbi:type VI secretion system contractile sheath large subunit [Azospirillum oryzae]|uniref:Type VI secretion system contractile sheath large subunit n=1 Tax=Azospirillum oryzae TaxID=286727 RepID=A0A6N1AV39_9PROT|nr:type VI secretion system contractile sheath large subunit [Azospirillum oryzae]KAA0590022.1 type VI secretion system contractile sheath large subunit [Azospirillum oryzae]QKS51862.1 type VI secretion system contractile sheath large subunit [Azospirillum oryzae]GLR81000.1 type VI secretion protein EvpB [Azospirillum oryzae]
MSEAAAEFHADDAEATVLERPLRLRAVDMAIGRDDPGLLDAFLAAKGPGEALRLWFGITLPVYDSLDTLRAALDRDIAAIDALLSEQVNAILHHKRFQSLEASWRGVRTLVKQAQTAETVVLRLLNLTWAELCRDQERAIEFDQSQLFNKVYSDEFGMPGGRPFGVLLCDYAVQHRPTKERPTDDVSGLKGLAQVAAAAFAPAIVGAAPELFGLETFHELGLPLDLKSVLRQTEYQRWHRFQETEDSRFIGVALPRVLMREPYGDDPQARHGFRYREESLGGAGGVAGGMRLEDHCWGNAVYAFGTVLIRSFLHHGWFADIRGAQRDVVGGGLVTELVVPDFATDATKVAQKFSVEVSISDQLERDLDDLGFIPVSRCKDTPYLVFYGNQSVQRVGQYTNMTATANARLSAMMRYMFCVARFAHFLKVMVRDRVGAFVTPEECERDLQSWLHGYCLGNDDASLDQKARYPLREGSIQVRAIPGKPGNYQCVIHLRPHFQLDQVFSTFKLVTELAQTGGAA